VFCMLTWSLNLERATGVEGKGGGSPSRTGRVIRGCFITAVVFLALLYADDVVMLYAR